MCTKTILRNIYYFLQDVLGNAYIGTGWDKEAYDRGLCWARYCEQTCERVARKPAEHQLNSLVQQLSSSLTPTILPCAVDLSHLKHASDVFRMALLQNPFISPELFNIVMSELKDEEMLQSIPILKDALKNMVEFLKKEPYDHKLVNGDTFTMTKWQMLEFRLFQKHIETLSKHHSHPSELKSALLNFLDSFENNRDTLVKLLLLMSENKPNITAFMKQVILRDWLLRKLSPDDVEFDEGLCWTFWDVPTNLIGHTCTNSLPFYKMYVKMLMNYAKELEAEYSSDGWKWKVSEKRSLKFSLSFSQLAQHFCGLLKTEGCVNKATTALLHEMCTSEGKLLWEDIQKSAQKLLYFSL